MLQTYCKISPRLENMSEGNLQTNELFKTSFPEIFEFQLKSGQIKMAYIFFNKQI